MSVQQTVMRKNSYKSFRLTLLALYFIIESMLDSELKKLKQPQFYIFHSVRSNENCSTGLKQTGKDYKLAYLMKK